MLQGDGTENHLVLVDVKKSYGIDGKFFEKALDMVGLTLNANALPTDKSAAFRPSGVRLGTPAITTRGMGVAEMEKIGDWMKQVVDLCVEIGDEAKLVENADKFAPIHEEVREFALKFPLPSEG